jgi:hypothetical protein
VAAKEHTTDEPPIELVRWIDSCTATDGSWTSLDNIQEDQQTYAHIDMHHTTVGFIVYEDNTAIVVARDLQDHHPKLRRQVGDAIKIPLVAIIHRKQLNPTTHRKAA